MPGTAPCRCAPLRSRAVASVRGHGLCVMAEGHAALVLYPYASAARTKFCLLDDLGLPSVLRIVAFDIRCIGVAP